VRPKVFEHRVGCCLIALAERLEGLELIEIVEEQQFALLRAAMARSPPVRPVEVSLEAWSEI